MTVFDATLADAELIQLEPGIAFHVDGYRLLHAGQETCLTRRENLILTALARRPEAYVNVAVLATAVGRPDREPVSDHAIEESIRVLRTKLRKAGLVNCGIRNCRGVGYGLFSRIEVAGLKGRQASVFDDGTVIELPVRQPSRSSAEAEDADSQYVGPVSM